MRTATSLWSGRPPVCILVLETGLLRAEAKPDDKRASRQAERAYAVGSRLRQLRRAAKLTQRQVAERVPMSAANLSRIENGEQGPPSEKIIEQIAHVLDTDPAELLTLAGRAAISTSADTLLRELR